MTVRKVLTVIGARPQFIKAAAVSRRLGDPRFSGLDEAIVHTGQHYDDDMSGRFFRDLGMPEPRWNLGAGGGGHGAQTGSMISGLEHIIDEWCPNVVLVYGDTNSTLAGALAAAKAGISLAHVEAGLRSFRRGMAEEVNRVVTDRLSDMLFCPTSTAVSNLAAEGRTSGVHFVGDVMFDMFRSALANADPDIPAAHGLNGRYGVATVHRAENTDNPARLARILSGLGDASRELPIILPLHPRTQKAMSAAGLTAPPGVRISPPLPYPHLVSLLKTACVVATDSGGLQKEAFFAGVPCVTLRDETEWVETVEVGWNRLSPPDAQTGRSDEIGRNIVAAAASRPSQAPPSIYGDGDAGARILELLLRVK